MGSAAPFMRKAQSLLCVLRSAAAQDMMLSWSKRARVTRAKQLRCQTPAMILQGFVQVWASAQVLCSCWGDETGSLSLREPLLLAAACPKGFSVSPWDAVPSLCVVWEPGPLFPISQNAVHPEPGLKWGVACSHGQRRRGGGALSRPRCCGI